LRSAARGIMLCLYTRPVSGTVEVSHLVRLVVPPGKGNAPETISDF
jgi:hypothetical protein